jgi:hypothetical protein
MPSCAKVVKAHLDRPRQDVVPAVTEDARDMVAFLVRHEEVSLLPWQDESHMRTVLAEPGAIAFVVRCDEGKLIGALIVLFIGLWIVNIIVRMMKQRMEKTKVDESLQPFLLSLVNVLLKIMVVFSAAGIVGIQTTSFVAMLGAAGLAVGLAAAGFAVAGLAAMGETAMVETASATPASRIDFIGSESSLLALAMCVTRLTRPRKIITLAASHHGR